MVGGTFTEWILQNASQVLDRKEKDPVRGEGFSPRPRGPHHATGDGCLPHCC